MPLNNSTGYWTKTFNGHAELFVNHIQENARGTLVWCGTCKVVDLLEEKDLFAVNGPMVQAWFMDGRNQANLLQD